MKKNEKKSIHYIIGKLIKIMNDRKLTKTAFADIIGFPEAKWNKISNGKQDLSIDELSKIAENLGLREIDILTYPKIFVETGKIESDIKAQITVELKEELKMKVLSLIFGNKNLEILNK
jgi:DNA-binding Xre family transcriptional regulator